MLVWSVRWRFGVTYKGRTMRRILNVLGYSYRKPKANTGKVGHSRRAERVHGPHQQAGDLVGRGYAILCGDDAACQKWSSGGYAWRTRGRYDTVDVSFSRSTVKMFGVLGRKRYHIRVVDALNSDTFIDFLKMLQKTYVRFVYVLDNASCHRSEKVNRFVESAGGDIVLVFLPPYTPQLNPVEIQWREPKRLLAGQCFKSMEDLGRNRDHSGQGDETCQDHAAPDRSVQPVITSHAYGPVRCYTAGLALRAPTCMAFPCAIYCAASGCTPAQIFDLAETRHEPRWDLDQFRSNYSVQHYA